ncbi:hypothetical protein DHW03_10980 [Pedobacter yonginense]|uniref:2Fe-2S ferredoxin-type domain-containing protein n=2 Tax=Pedobacter yonginense TaxID=651869 RepID=A0A317ENZ5_9SPHI|nr:hypothetical protein DHW03_10980 [Pedobacter yonginense]
MILQNFIEDQKFDIAKAVGTYAKAVYGIKNGVAEYSQIKAVEFPITSRIYQSDYEDRSSLKSKLKASTSAGKKYKVQLAFPNNSGEVSFDCPEDVYILDAALAEGIDLPYSGRVGVDGASACRLITGSVDQSEQSFLSDCLINNGFILLEVAYAKSDVRILVNQQEELSTNCLDGVNIYPNQLVTDWTPPLIPPFTPAGPSSPPTGGGGPVNPIPSPPTNPPATPSECELAATEQAGEPITDNISPVTEIFRISTTSTTRTNHYRWPFHKDKFGMWFLRSTEVGKHKKVDGEWVWDSIEHIPKSEEVRGTILPGGTIEIVLNAYPAKGKKVAGVYLDYYLNMHIICKGLQLMPLQTTDFTNIAFWTVDN